MRPFDSERSAIQFAKVGRENPASVVRRGAARCAELLFLGEFLDSSGICPGLTGIVHANFAGFVLMTVAASALYDFFDMLTRPDLEVAGQPPCNEESPMLPFDDGNQ